MASEDPRPALWAVYQALDIRMTLGRWRGVAMAATILVLAARVALALGYIVNRSFTLDHDM